MVAAVSKAAVETTVSTRVTLCGIEMDNPVMAASGTFGYGKEFTALYDINQLGSFSFKGTTLEPRFGNETPRIAECPQGMLNSVGLQNPGVDAVISEELPALAKVFHKPVMANVCGGSPEEYAAVTAKLEAAEQDATQETQPQIGRIEVNISCPNVKDGGMAFGTDPKAAASVISAVRRETKKPLIAKLSPNVTDIAEIAKACEAAGADGLTAINTLLGMRIDLRTGKPILAREVGGFSGPAVFPIALRAVWQVTHAVDIPVIGCGGISSAEDVLEMMMAGAKAVQVGSANLVDPYACVKIIEELPAAMEKYGITSLEGICSEESRKNM